MQTSEASIDVVISYSRAESDFVDRLESDLKSHHLITWVDRSKLVPGQVWNAEILSAIDHCRILLVIISPTAVDSPDVTREWQYALKHYKDVIPVRYFPPEKLPPELQRLQWVDFLLTMQFEATYPAQLQALLKAIDLHVERYNTGETARQAQQAIHAKRTRVRLAGGLASCTLLVFLVGVTIGHIFFPLEVVKTIPALQQFPVFHVTLGIWSSDFEPPYAGNFTVYAHSSVAVDNSGYVIQLVDHTDGDRDVQRCTTGSTCSVTLTCPQSAKLLVYEASFEQDNVPLSAVGYVQTTVNCPPPPR